jgi:signal transduction histidine kinase
MVALAALDGGAVGMSETSLVDRLAAHRTLSGAPRSQLEWLAAHGRVLNLPVGEIASDEESPLMNGLVVMLSGQLVFRVDRGTGPRKVIEWNEGDVTGTLPYSRLVKAPGVARAERDVESLFVASTHFPAMARECYELTAILVHVMLDRARLFTSSDLQVEKMLSLGRLAAGLAHELNNPASAVERSAVALRGLLAEVETASQRLAEARLSKADGEAIERVRTRCATTEPRHSRSPVERADREDEIAEWLRRHGLDGHLAESLADSVVTVEAFDQLADELDGARLDVALRWVAAICGARRIADEIETAASRIHQLVGAVRGFTYLDQGAAPKPVDVGKGLSDTLVVLRSKARVKSASVHLEVAPGIPLIDGYGGELNQVWANLIDNALDAVPVSGRVNVSAHREGGFVVVRIIDNGPGLSEAVQRRAFEPFFTTKPVGVGTGLGLDIARRIVDRHGGQIEFETRPGRTEFRVLLPTD